MFKNWNDASQHCMDLSARLVVIHSGHMLHFVNHIEDTLSLGNIHIGLYLNGLNFSWVDGSDMVYSKWSGGQPDNNGGGEGCVVQTNNYHWNDVPCTTFYSRFICQQPIEGKRKSNHFGCIVTNSYQALFPAHHSRQLRDAWKSEEKSLCTMFSHTNPSVELDFHEA